MKRLLLALLSAGTATPAAAELTIRPLADLRLRYENVEQDGFARDADAVSLRARLGFEAARKHWSIIVEGEGIVAPIERYDSGVNDKIQYPIVADPGNVELNRLQLQYRGLPKAVVTLGRQRINLQDQRFVGAVGWRQNEQTFDGARIEYGTPNGPQADLSYVWSVRTIWGIDGRGLRQRAVGGDNFFATVSHPTPMGKLSSFAYFVDQDEAAVQGYRLSSKTFGVRLTGSRSLSRVAKVTWAGSYARQSDHHRNPNDYSAAYWLAEAGFELSMLKLGIGYEQLGADEGLPLTSFQTPLATLHKFQGWADKFLTTPPNGIQDYYASAGYGWKKTAGLDAINASVAYHRFDSERLDLHYGNEWNALLSVKKGRWTAIAKLASYDAKDFATDTRKIWLQLEWAY